MHILSPGTIHLFESYAKVIQIVDESFLFETIEMSAFSNNVLQQALGGESDCITITGQTLEASTAMRSLSFSDLDFALLSTL
jgi:hypothetical protein